MWWWQKSSLKSSWTVFVVNYLPLDTINLMTWLMRKNVLNWNVTVIYRKRSSSFEMRLSFETDHSRYWIHVLPVRYHLKLIKSLIFASFEWYSIACVASCIKLPSKKQIMRQKNNPSRHTKNECIRNSHLYMDNTRFPFPPIFSIYLFAICDMFCFFKPPYHHSYLLCKMSTNCW